MKHPFLIAGFLCLGLMVSFSSHAQQSYTFSYDDNGNRESRTITIPGLKSTSKADSALNREYKDVIGKLEIVLYPNPTKGEINIELKNFEGQLPISISVHDVTGHLLRNYTSFHESTVIDLSGLPRATYILKIRADGKQTEWKIIKE